ncbi:unnamed protein product [Tetraodon nigroviridis]|uniref:Tetraspanin n=1 Tax=Tetraodon nigroviridis TaxID=99883 RepID=Q4SU90_TETNG|nr:unnamed protein product [Tetraodon nigroviridis]
MAPRRMETKPVIFCLQTVLLLYSFVFWVTGAVLLSVGLWWKFMLGPYMLLISNSPSNGPLVLAGTGGAIVLFGLFGCFATCRGRPWMLKLYAVFLALVFMTELIAGISGFIFRHEVTAKMNEHHPTLANAQRCRLGNKLHLCVSVCVQIKGTFFTTYNEAVMRYDGLDDRSLAVDGVQRSLRCCGVHNYTSWFNSVYFPVSGFPASCCVSFSDCSYADLKNSTLAARKVHKQGCYQLVTSFIERNMGIIAGVTFGIAFSQGMSLACCLSRFIHTNQYEMV